MSFPILLALFLVNANVDAANFEDALISDFACYDPAGMSCTCTGSMGKQFSGITGTIPAALSACTGVTALNFQYNAVSGTLPPELSTLTSLHVIWFQGSNVLTGTLPPELSTITSMGSMCVIRPSFPCSLRLDHTPHSDRFGRSLVLPLG